MAQSLRLPSGAVHEIEIVDDIAEAFTDEFTRAFFERRDDRFIVALSGGPTAKRCYERLAATSSAAHAAGGPAVDWPLVDVVMGDERCVPPDDPDANQRLVREALIDRVGTVGSFHPMSCEDPPAYQSLLESLGRLDLVHLGMGPDGHTASLFPGSPAMNPPPGTLVMRSADPSEKNPHDRMTITFEAIASAGLALFTVSGAAKADAFAALRAGKDVPAARVRARRVLMLVDREAAGEI